MSSSRRLWMGLETMLVLSFTVLLWVGGEIHRVMPPIPSAVVTSTGQTIYTRADIQMGRQVWQSIGGHQLGSIWGHSSYRSASSSSVPLSITAIGTCARLN